MQSCHAEVKKTQETLLDNLKDNIDLTKDIIKMFPDSNYKQAFKYISETLKAAESIAVEAKSATGEASLAHLCETPPAIIPLAQHSQVCLRHRFPAPTSTDGKASDDVVESQGEKRAGDDTGTVAKKKKMHVLQCYVHCCYGCFKHI